MTRAIEPLVDQRDYFNSVRIDRPRLYSQIVDNMNKAAIVGFPISEIGSRLKSALASGVEQAHIFDDAQTCALAFRKYCLAIIICWISRCSWRSSASMFGRRGRRGLTCAAASSI